LKIRLCGELVSQLAPEHALISALDIAFSAIEAVTIDGGSDFADDTLIARSVAGTGKPSL
jgi:hypothetical protein